MRILRTLPCRGISSGYNFRNRLNEHVEQLSKPEGSKRSTIDITEVEHHSKLSNKWWNTKGELSALHTLNCLRVQFVRDGLANMGVGSGLPYLPLQGTKIVDVGCGGGILTEPLARIGAEVTGIDASSELIKAASEHATLDPKLSDRLNYVCTTIEKFTPENENGYDAVVASEVVEHVNDQKLFLKCCVDILKPGGSLFITTLNKTLPAWLGGIIMAEHVLKIVPPGTHDWNKFIPLSEIQCLLETYGCKTKLIHGMLYNPLKNEWLWVTSTAIHYAIHAVKRGKQQ